jgi:competence protein ComEA
VGKLKKTEAAWLAAAAAALALAVAVRLFSAASAAQIDFSPADRSASVWAEASPELPYERAAGQDININSADAETLTLLPGIGEALAGRIIRYREENGGFSDISEILSVNGIGQATFDKIKDYITAEDMP